LRKTQIQCVSNFGGRCEKKVHENTIVCFVHISNTNTVRGITVYAVMLCKKVSATETFVEDKTTRYAG